MMRSILRFTSVFGFQMLAGAQGEQKQIKHTAAQATSPASGREMFVSYCAACHGKDPKGDGPPASALKIQPADLTVLSKK
jgi:mono/diheme cytochrome c family protein